MTIEITAGRYRGLKMTSLGEADIFGILAFDQRGSYRRMMPDNTSYQQLVQVKVEIISELAKDASAVLTDPIYGLSPAMHMNGKAGLLMALEKSGYSGDSTYRKVEFIDSWTPEKIRKMGASAAKLLVYYNPQAETLADELDEMIRQVVRDCHAWDLPLFLEPLSYSLDANIPKNSPEFAQQRADIVVETARRLSQTGIDILKMEFPVDLQFNQDHDEWRKQCERLSAASSIPWVLLSAGVDFEEFEPQVLIACESGASGFLAGRAIWKEGAAMPTDERQAFLTGTATDRLRKLIRIAQEKARPWTDFYNMQPSTENWYATYG
ncbi:MAG: tagatose 1,6-diphosphate aldolase [Anaerolineae bacterium]|nr:tagatose 1,6-diphosphate aldolase [Anaerolineae bacterium]